MSDLLAKWFAGVSSCEWGIIRFTEVRQPPYGPSGSHQSGRDDSRRSDIPKPRASRPGSLLRAGMTWVHLPRSPYLPARAVARLPPVCSGIALCATSNTTRTAKQCCAIGSLTAPLKMRRFGMTSEPSTVTHGPASWISYLLGSRANRSASQGQSSPAKISGTAGLTPAGSFAKYDRASHSWRTYQGLLPGLTDTLAPSSPTWPRSGTTRNGRAYQRQKLAPRIDVTGFGYSLPTPTCHDSKGTGPYLRRRKSPGLASVVEYPTPNAADAKRCDLRWPTPTVHGNYNRKGLSKTSGDGLQTAVGGRLNPTWVEWLMMWPSGHTGLSR